VLRDLLALLAVSLGFSAAAVGGDVQPFVPVLTEDFPDPFVLPQDGVFLAYATNPRGGGVNVQMARSTNLVDWEVMRDGDKPHDAMPVLPSWARDGFTWAPEVIKTDRGYVLHFTARERKSGLQCLGAALSASPYGPFVSDAPEPLVCQRELGGTIDSDPFRDADGQLYLYYKNDGNNPRVKLPTTLFVQHLTADAMHVTGEPVALVRNDANWEGQVIEAPTMVLHDGRYVLFFSANYYGWDPGQSLSPYAMGYATCGSAAGPCSAAGSNPILHSYDDRHAGCLSGPGHQSVFATGGRTFIAFHAWGTVGACRNAHRGRYLYVAPLSWRNGTPQLGVSLRQP
jgi:beta-xylosidase